MTGGGPGIMEAANRGAKEVGGRSVGCNIELPFEQGSNMYLDRCIRLHYFFVRKALLIKYSYAFVVMPGGVGYPSTSFLRRFTLIQEREDQKFPIVIMGTDYWRQLIDFIKQMAQRENQLCGFKADFRDGSWLKKPSRTFAPRQLSDLGLNA